MNQRQRLPIWRDSQRQLIAIEQAVRGFSRYHKYTLGSELRKQAYLVMRLLVRALNSRDAERERYVRQLVAAQDDLKVLIVTARELKLYSSFSQFQALSELVVATGKQGGAWLRRLTADKPQPEPGARS